MPPFRLQVPLAGRFLPTRPAPVAIRSNGKKLVESARFAGRESLTRVSGEGVCNIAILGFGTVGSAVGRILAERAPAGLRLTHVCNRAVARKKVDWLPVTVEWTEDFNTILSSDVDLVVELMGGLNPAGDCIRSALLAGKSVVTANKQLIAHCGTELIDLARRSNCQLLFGASVAGGIPVISALQEGLAGDELLKIHGILNGTCNYILSQIERRGISFAEALAEAQRMGFAESDPSEDVDGLDARAKLAILVRVGLHANVQPESIAGRSISSIEAVDFDYASQLGCTIRQVSSAEWNGKRLLAGVRPALVPLSSPLARIQGSENLVVSTGKYGRQTVFGGQGAGGSATAVAVVSDIFAIAGRKVDGCGGNSFDCGISPTVSAEFSTRHYLRFTVKDQPGIIAALASVFSKADINIDSVLQKPGYTKSRLPFVITLEACKSSKVEKALQRISRFDFLVQPSLNLPILN
jgi:homoserine dehydrogenase